MTGREVAELLVTFLAVSNAAVNFALLVLYVRSWKDRD